MDETIKLDPQYLSEELVRLQRASFSPEDDLQNFGPEMVEFVQRTVRQVMASEIQRLREEVAQILREAGVKHG
jgi:phytoene/squalene synthetase